MIDKLATLGAASALAAVAALGALAGWMPTAAADSAAAPDVVVFCEPTLCHAVAALGSVFRQRSNVPVRIFASPTKLMLEQASHHIRVDFLFGEGEDNATAALRRQIIDPATRLGGWRNRLVVARRASSSGTPAVLGPGSFEPPEAGPVAIVDAPVAAAGAATMQALQALGLWDRLRGRVIGVVGTADAVFLLAQGRAALAIVYATDVAADRSLSVAATMPDASYPPILDWAAATSFARSPQAGRFTAFLATQEARAILRSAGLEVPQ